MWHYVGCKDHVVVSITTYLSVHWKAVDETVHTQHREQHHGPLKCLLSNLQIHLLAAASEVQDIVVCLFKGPLVHSLNLDDVDANLGNILGGLLVAIDKVWAVIIN